jgi:hypothetical protein
MNTNNPFIPVLDAEDRYVLHFLVKKMTKTILELMAKEESEQVGAYLANIERIERIDNPHVTRLVAELTIETLNLFF